MKKIKTFSFRLLGVLVGVCTLALSALAQPTITSFTPTSGPVGTTVTITGTNFNTTPANNRVFLGATRASVTSASTTRLVVTVPLGATYAPITVLNTATKLMASSNTAFTPTYTPPRYDLRAADFAAIETVDQNGWESDFVAIGDLDGDGRADVVAVRQGVNYVSVLRNNSTSDAVSFDPQIDFATGGTSNSVAIGDLNGDGKADLVVAHSNGISVLQNNSTGGTITRSSFATKVDFMASTSIVSVAIGDLDGDGRADLALANDYNKWDISVLRNTFITGAITNSSFAAKVDFPVGGFFFSIAIADLDGDRKPDLAVAKKFGVANGDLSSAAAVLRNTSTNGVITFATYQDFVTAQFPNAGEIIPTSIAVGDLDGDGKPDLTVADYDNNKVSVFRNTSSTGAINNQSFAAKVDFPVGAARGPIAIADLTGDGKADLAVANLEGGGSVSILRNVSTPNTLVNTSFAAKVDFKVSSNPESLAIADLNGDGKADVVTADPLNGVRILRKLAVAPLAITSVSPTSGVVGTPVTINGSNFATKRSDNSVFFGTIRARITAHSSSQLTVVVPPGCSYAPITVFNRFSGLSATSAHFSPTFTPAKETISSTDFNEKVDFPVGTLPSSHAIGDVDSDGKADLVVVNSADGTLSVRRNVSNNDEIADWSFAPSVDFELNSRFDFEFNDNLNFEEAAFRESVAIVDLDGDEKPDLVVGTNRGVSVFRNTILFSGPFTSSSFAQRVDFEVEVEARTIVRHVAVGDLDGDGKPDLAIADEKINSVFVLRNISGRGEIRFAAKEDFLVGDGPRFIAIGDLDGDGKADLAVVNYNYGEVAILRNTTSSGLLSFSSPESFPVGGNPESIAIGDLDGDGNADLATANFTPDLAEISVLVNTRTTIGAISFAVPTDFSVGRLPQKIAIGDVTGDGKADVATVDPENDRVIVLCNTSTTRGTISFAPNVDFATGDSPVSLAIGDLDGDGRVDLTVVNQSDKTISALKNNPMIALAATATTSNSFTANWAPVNGVPSYQLDVSTDSNFGSFVSGYSNLSVVGTSSVVSGLAANTTYHYRVRSFTGVASQNSNVITVTTLPAAPTGVAVSAAATNAFTASWDYVANLSYTLEVSETADFATIAFSITKSESATAPDPGKETHTLTPPIQVPPLTTFSFQDGRTYFLRVRATSAAGTSANSLTVSFNPRPLPPTSTSSLSPGQGSFTASWSLSNGATSYLLDVSKNKDMSPPFILQVAATSTSFNVQGLDPGTTYYFQVKARNDAGTSLTAIKSDSVVTIPTTPFAIDPLVAESNKVTAKWVSVDGVDKYLLTFADNAAFTPSTTLVVPKTDTTKLLPNLVDGKQYFYRVAARNGSGISLPSNIVSFFTKPVVGGANGITGLVAVPEQITQTSFLLSWNTVASATGYFVDVCTDNTFAICRVNNRLQAGNTNSSFNATNLSPSTTYFVRVRATNAAGTSPSASISVTTDSNIPAPTATAATGVSTTGFTANWLAAIGATKYKLFLFTDASLNNPVATFPRIVNEQSAAITGLPTGQTFYYQVAAMNDKNLESAPSNTIATLLPQTVTAEMPFGIGGNIGDYRIRSYPAFIGTTTIEEAGLTKSNFLTFWRVLHYDTDTKKTEDVSDVMTLAPATGYWTNARAPVNVKVRGNYKEQDYTLTLKPGWNQIGNPFLNKGIVWDNVLSANSNVEGVDKIGKLYTYNEPAVSAAQPFQTSDLLRAYGGGFVSNKSDKDVTLIIRANTSGGRAGREEAISASPVGDKWMLPIALSVGDYESRLGGIGMNPDASTGIDKYDELALPRFFQYVEFASGGLMRSVVPTAAKHEWLFQAAANGDDTKGTISWNSTALNAGGAARLYLHDQTTNTLLDMSQHSSYAFDLKKGNQVKFIYLQDGMPTESIVAEPYPNPFASSVAVPIMMVEETEVALTVYDLTGGVVYKSLTALPAGFSELTWTNADAPQGLYLMKIETGKDRVVRKVMKR